MNETTAYLVYGFDAHHRMMPIRVCLSEDTALASIRDDLAATDTSPLYERPRAIMPITLLRSSKES